MPHPSPEAGRRRLALMLDAPDWHSARLTAAFAAQGVALVPTFWRDAAFATGSAPGLTLKGFATLPEAVLVRQVGGRSFEAVTWRLGLLHALAGLGVTVINSAPAIEAATDKGMAAFRLAQAGIATPASFTVAGRRAALVLVRRELAQGPLVLKPLFGAQGRGLHLISRPDDLPPAATVRGIYHLQRYVGASAAPFRDVRLLVAHGAVIGAMQRRAGHWITNLARGGTPLWIEPDHDLQGLALAGARTLGLIVAGVDLMRGHDGAWQVLEVNAMPGFAGMQSVAPFDIAGAMAARLLAALPEGSQGR
ncbi:MAG: RimK family alpha-L-glutamate ligase [Hyphomicrobiales bacterium]|nr:RimK family alpha-L-glutamate ligase [Hyphomicrobiales bacterium]